jgi:hypothetical protein
MSRLVVILCGPPGSGKTTAARASGLRVYDRDDSQWQSERQFTDALATLGRDPSARAVVIRSAASSSARARWAKLVRATHIFVVLLPPDECLRRVRNRGRADMVRGLASVPKWFAAFDNSDGVQIFSGWNGLANSPGLPMGNPSRRW